MAAAGTGRKAGQQMVPMSQGGEGGERIGGAWKTAAAHSNSGLVGGEKGSKSDGFLEKGMVQEITV